MRGGEDGDRLVDPAAGGGIAAVERGVIHGIDRSEHHDVDRLGDVVEDHHAVVETKRQVWLAAVVEGCIGQLFHVADRVVARVADDAAGEWREFRKPGNLERSHAPLEFGERIGALEGLDSTCPRHRHFGAPCLEPQERVGRQKAVAAHLLSTDNALKQAGSVP